MRKFIIGLGLCFATGVTMADVDAVSTNKTVDVASMDIGGFKIGMSFNEAVEIVKSRYKQKPQQGKRSCGWDCSTYYIDDTNNIWFYTKTHYYTIRFYPIEEDGRTKMILEGLNIGTRVGYYAPGNADLLRKSAIEKYGQPTFVDYHGNLKYCSDIGKGEYCGQGPELDVSSDISAKHTALRTLYHQQQRNKTNVKPAL